MENKNQRIIFLVPEDATPAQIILDILKKNGFNSPTDDITDKNKTPRLIIINNSAKDFFDKKLTEEKMSELFQNELKISKENATGIIDDIKKKLIPFAKKITVPAYGEEIKTPEKFNAMTKTELPIGAKQAIEEPIINNNIEIPVNKKSKIKKITETKEDLKPDIRQNKGPDNYREPIE